MYKSGKLFKKNNYEVIFRIDFFKGLKEVAENYLFNGLLQCNNHVNPMFVKHLIQHYLVPMLYYHFELCKLLAPRTSCHILRYTTDSTKSWFSVILQHNAGLEM